jgi:hypothetical protein
MKLRCDVVYQDVLKPPHVNRVDALTNLSVFDTALRSSTLLVKPPVCFDHPPYISGPTHSPTHAVQDTFFRTHTCRAAVCRGVYVDAIPHQGVLFAPPLFNAPPPVATHPIQGILKPKLTELLQSFGRLRYRCSATIAFVTTTTTKNALSRLLYCCLHRRGTTKVFPLTTNYNIAVRKARKD